MARLSKEARELQKEFLPLGTEIAALTHRLFQKGCYITGRIMQHAQESYGQDVENIIHERKRSKDNIDHVVREIKADRRKRKKK